MHENASGRGTFLVNLMFRRLDKFDGPIFERGCIYGAGSVLTKFYWIYTYIYIYIYYIYIYIYIYICLHCINICFYIFIFIVILELIKSFPSNVL